MENFIPYEKLSKKKQRELSKARRTLWQRSPITRRSENPKAYKRSKARKDDFDDRFPCFVFS